MRVDKSKSHTVAIRKYDQREISSFVVVIVAFVVGVVAVATRRPDQG